MSARLLIDLWLLGLLTAVALQTLWPRQLSAGTSWGFAPGWQREIALWNIALAVLILALRLTQARADAVILPVLALLSLMLGTNHLVAAIKAPDKLGHWAGVAGNFLGVILYLIYLLSHPPIQR
jgi:KinB signaling pathway activation protein